MKSGDFGKINEFGAEIRGEFGALGGKWRRLVLRRDLGRDIARFWGLAGNLGRSEAFWGFSGGRCGSRRGAALPFDEPLVYHSQHRLFLSLCQSSQRGGFNVALCALLLAEPLRAAF